MNPLIFPEGSIAPLRLTGVQESMKPNDNTLTYWSYNFEVDLEQAEFLRDQVMERRAHPTWVPPGEPEPLDGVGGEDQQGVVANLRLSTKNPVPVLEVGGLYDVMLVPREELARASGGLTKLLNAVFGRTDANVGPVTIVPMVDLQATEYDQPPDMEGLPYLGEIDCDEWQRASLTERLILIARAREEQK